MHVWKVKVQGEDFWFNLNKKAGNMITEGDTIYGLFDEETVTPKDKSKEPFTVKKFVKVKRPDGSFDKVQARQSSGGDSPSTQAPSGQLSPRDEARILRLENQLGLPPIEFMQPMANDSKDVEDEPLKASDIPL